MLGSSTAGNTSTVYKWAGLPQEILETHHLPNEGLSMGLLKWARSISRTTKNRRPTGHSVYIWELTGTIMSVAVIENKSKICRMIKIVLINLFQQCLFIALNLCQKRGYSNNFWVVAECMG